MEMSGLFILLFLVLVISSVPIHEAGHFLMLKALGAKETKVTWLKFRFLFLKQEEGSGTRRLVIEVEGFVDFPNLESVLPHHRKGFAFLVGASGGASVFLGYGSIALLLLFNPFYDITPFLWGPFAIVALLHLLIGIQEWIRVSEKIEGAETA